MRTTDGTTYGTKTPQGVIDVLERVRKSGVRITLDYGNPKTGKSWNEIWGVSGYVSRSSGRIQIPILLYNSRSKSGGAIMDEFIIGIKTSKGKKVLYP